MDLLKNFPKYELRAEPLFPLLFLPRGFIPLHVGLGIWGREIFGLKWQTADLNARYGGGTYNMDSDDDDILFTQDAKGFWVKKQDAEVGPADLQEMENHNQEHERYLRKREAALLLREALSCGDVKAYLFRPDQGAPLQIQTHWWDTQGVIMTSFSIRDLVESNDDSDSYLHKSIRHTDQQERTTYIRGRVIVPRSEIEKSLSNSETYKNTIASREWHNVVNEILVDRVKACEQWLSELMESEDFGRLKKSDRLKQAQNIFSGLSGRKFDEAWKKADRTGKWSKPGRKRSIA